MNEFEQDVRLDRYNLENELQRQSDIIKKWTQVAAIAKSDRDNLKEKLDDVYSELDLEVRSDLKKFMTEKEFKNIKKITESVIESLIKRQKEYKELRKKYLDAKRDFEIIEGGISALDHKRTSMKFLSDLWINGYWSTDIGVPREETINDDIREELNNFMKKRRSSKNE